MPHGSSTMWKLRCAAGTLHSKWPREPRVRQIHDLDLGISELNPTWHYRACRDGTRRRAHADHIVVIVVSAPRYLGSGRLILCPGSDRSGAIDGGHALRDVEIRARPDFVVGRIESTRTSLPAEGAPRRAAGDRGI